jgi:hypothetical protein
MLFNNAEAIQTFFNMDCESFTAGYGGTVTTKAKHRWFWKTLDRIYYALSFGKSKDFMRRATTIGPIIAFGEQVDLKRVTKMDYITLKHELTHVRQCAKLAFGEPLFGMPLFLFLYLFVPLPAYRSWFRFKFEREAFMEEYKTARKYGWTPSVDDFIDALSGPDYLYAWPKEKVKEWFVQELTKG